MHTILRGTAVSLATVAMLAGCGSSSSTSTAAASKANFCRDNATLDKATASATTAPEVLKALKANQATVIAFGKAAPSAISAQAQVLVNGTNAAIKANSATVIENAKFAAAGKAVDSYCGQQSNGSPAST